MTKPDITVNSHSLEGATVVITGTLKQLTRKEAEELVVEAGGKVGSSVTKNTTVVIAGEKAGSKIAKAKELDIPIRREKDLLSTVDMKNCGLMLIPVEAEEQQPDWVVYENEGDELVKGDELKRCAHQLLSNNEPEEVALILNYKYMDGKGHDQPLVGHLFKAMEAEGIDIDEDELDTNDMIDIYKGQLIKHLDYHGTNVWIPKAKYDENPQDYDHACDWEEEEDWEEFDYPEPMVKGDLTTLVYIGPDMEYSDIMDDDEILDYYEVPNKYVYQTAGYG